MDNQSELERFPLALELTGPHAASLKKLLRRAAAKLSGKQIEEMIPVFRDGGKLAENRRKR